jgi:hypothetical protein
MTTAAEANRRQLATLLAHASDRTSAEPASDGPPERVIGQADLDWLADREEARETRWREGA